MKKYLAIVVLFLTGWATAQTPCFTISAPTGCVPHTITVTDCSGHPTSPLYNYEANIDPSAANYTTATTHSYTEPGTYELIQAIDVGGIFKRDTQTVQVYPVPTPSFEITNCGGQQVHLTIPNWGYDQYLITWAPGVTDLVTAAGTITHTYASNTLQNITLEARYLPENCGSDTTLSITPIGSFTQPNIDTLLVLDNTRLVLAVSGQNRVPYQIDMYTNGTFASTHEYIPEGNRFTDTISGLATNLNTYCFIIRAYNRCASTTETTGDEVCSVHLSGSAQAGFNDVRWTGYDGVNFQLYDLQRNSISLQTFPITTENYADSAILCSQAYAYQLVTSAANQSTSVSISNVLTLSGQSAANPQAVDGIFSSFDASNKLTISWNEAPNIVPLYYTVNAAQTSDTFYATTPSQLQCYRVSYTDSCGNTSAESEQTCPIFVEAVDNGLFSILLNWNAYVSFTSGLSHYEVLVYDDSKQLLQTIPVGQVLAYDFNPGTDPMQEYYFTIRGISADGRETYSNTVQIILQNLLLVPNAFSPNGDGVNDTFLAKVRFTESYQLAIYNQWGEQIYTTSNPKQGWNGQYTPPGVYSYIIQATDSQGETLVKKGTVTLLR